MAKVTDKGYYDGYKENVRAYGIDNAKDYELFLFSSNYQSSTGGVESLAAELGREPNMGTSSGSY